MPVSVSIVVFWFVTHVSE